MLCDCAEARKGKVVQQDLEVVDASPITTRSTTGGSLPTISDHVKELNQRVAANHYGTLRPHDGAHSELSLFDANLYEEPQKSENLRGYYSLCRDAECLVVTMSCFAIWNKNGKTNGFGKVIPAVRVAEAIEQTPPSPSRAACCLTSATGTHTAVATAAPNEEIKVFFFDDNLEMEGFAQSPGICNLRDIMDDQFVDFGVGHNGFVSERAGSHTTVHYSSQYNNVLVKANILDAMEDREYFLKIIRRFTNPSDKCLVYMDINSAIVCSDSVSGKSNVAILLSTMFELIDLKPYKEAEFQWEGRTPITVKAPTGLKSLVKKIAADDKDFYNTFYTLERCLAFVRTLTYMGTIRWKENQDICLTADTFRESFERYLAVITDQKLDHGITQSWFVCYEAMRSLGHTAVLNSFGIDTKTVVEKTVADVSEAMQVTINYNLWDDRDAKKFRTQYCNSELVYCKASQQLVN